MNKYEYYDENTTKVIVLNTKNPGEFLISNSDLERVKAHSWYIKDTTDYGHVPYIASKINNSTIKLHRFIMNASKGVVVDHINRNSFDNRRENLRIVSYRENNINCSKSKNNTSGRTGVYFVSAKGTHSAKWVAQWVEPDSKKIQKHFAISKYGESEAKRLAESARNEAEDRLDILTEK